MIYLATTYTTEDLELLEERYEIALDIVQFLTNKSEIVYSPIVHFHEVAKKYALPTGFDFWSKYDKHMVDISEKVYFALIPGYSKSRGMKEEYDHAVLRNKDRHIVLPELSTGWKGGRYIISNLVTGDFLGDNE